MSEHEDITFEQGYEELKALTARLGEDNVPIEELLESFRRGRGLEKALSAYLTDREGELTEIESGNNLPVFNIIAPSAPVE
jgi:exodeoxyribonuclease VII small subunit